MRADFIKEKIYLAVVLRSRCIVRTVQNNLYQQQIDNRSTHDKQHCNDSSSVRHSLQFPPAHSQTRSIDNSFITLNVGEPHLAHPQRDTFLVQRADLIRSSVYLQALLVSPQTSTIDLLDIDANLLSVYLTWLDYSSICTTSFYDLAQLFSLANRLQDPDFSRAVIQNVINVAQQTDSYPDLSAINIIYGASEKGSGARKLLTDFYLYGIDQAWLDAFEAATGWTHQDYIDDVLLALATTDRRGQGLPWVRDASVYLGEGDEHEYEVDETHSGHREDEYCGDEMTGIETGDARDETSGHGHDHRYEEIQMDTDVGGEGTSAPPNRDPPMSNLVFTLAYRTRH